MINDNDYKPEVLELLHQPWTIEIRPYSDGGFFARVVELRGCMTEADTQLEALQQLEESQAEWLAAALEAGDPIPKPSGDHEFSGKIFVRTSPHLHRMVSEAAMREGVSMSQWVSEVLSRAVSFQDLRLWWQHDALPALRELGAVNPRDIPVLGAGKSSSGEAPEFEPSTGDTTEVQKKT